MANALSRKPSFIAISIVTSEIWCKVQLKKKHDPNYKSHYSLLQDQLKKKHRVVMGNDQELKQLILKHFHDGFWEVIQEWKLHKKR